MRIKDIMTKDLIVTDEDASILDAKKIMKDNKIRRLPVVNNGKLVGLVTERMLLEAAPSQATALSIHELQYLLAKMTVKDIMVNKPVSISSNMAAEEALKLGRENGYGGFPVVDNGKLVGIITESDIVKIMTRILGVYDKGVRLDIEASKEYGNLQKIMKIIDDKKIRLLSLMVLDNAKTSEDRCTIYMRLMCDNGDEIATEIKAAGFNVTDVG